MADRRGAVGIAAVNAADEGLVRQTIALAREARAAGNHPFGALLALDGSVVLTARNSVHTGNDPRAHAETNLVTDAIRTLTSETTVYALPSEELATLAGGSFLVPCRDLLSRAKDRVW